MMLGKGHWRKSKTTCGEKHIKSCVIPYIILALPGVTLSDNAHLKIVKELFPTSQNLQWEDLIGNKVEEETGKITTA